MGSGIKKVVFVIAIITALMLAVNNVYAATIDTDLISLATSKVLALAGIITSQTNSDLDNERQQVENNTLAYIDSYIQGIQNDLNIYASQQESDAKAQLDTSYTNVKNQLDSSRQTILDNAEQQIQQIINSQLQQEQQQLNSELNSKIADKLK